jgi:glucose-6-phosphate isomerase/transaldolase/glucose-6-phosphate isomerase
LLDGAKEAWGTTLRDDSQPTGGEPAGVWLGAALSALAQSGRDKLTFVIAESLPGLGLWLEQLVAESTGKQGTGILPVAEEPLDEPSTYGEDRVFAYFSDLDAPDAELDAKVRALGEAGHPLLELPTRGPGDLGRVFMLAEIAVAVAGWGLQINPFDQPNVQQAKDATKRVLAGYEAEHRLREARRRRPSATVPASCTRRASFTRAGQKSGASCSCSLTARGMSRSRAPRTASRR